MGTQQITAGNERIYSEEAIRALTEIIQWKDEDDVPRFFDDLESIGRGCNIQQASNNNINDREKAAECMAAVFKALKTASASARNAKDKIAEALHKLEEAKDYGGGVGVFMEPLNWNYEHEIENAAGELDAFVKAAESALMRYKIRMGTSPTRPDPVWGWVMNVWFLYKSVDLKPAIGRKGNEGDPPGGRFQRLLLEAAAPLRIEFNWMTTRTRLKRLQDQFGT